MIRVNLIVEDFGTFKYLGCATAARNLYKGLSKNIEVSWNDKSFSYDIAHFHTFGPKSLLYARKFKGKKVITAHSTPNLNIGNLAMPFLVNWLYNPIYNYFDRIIAVSNKCKRELIEEMRVKRDVVTIYNGIDTENFKPDAEKRKNFREKYGIEKDEMVILTVAQRTPRKGIYDFLEIAKHFSNLRFIWIGGFPYGFFSKDYSNIKKMIERKTSNVLFPGFIEDITTAYSASDIFLMPSYAEGHSIVMLEALAMQLPIIARDLEEFREAFDDNLIYFGDKIELKDYLSDENLLEEYKEKTVVVKKFDIDKIAQQHIDFYEKLLES